MNLYRLTAEQAEPLLAFERDNRAYFAATIPDRGDDYFANFAAVHEETLAEQAAGLRHMHVIVDDEGRVLGRINLFDVKDGSAELGYRIAQSAAGRGLATAGVGRIREMAVDDYGLSRLRARTTLNNLASRAVLERAGFEAYEEIELSNGPGLAYALEL
jgi:ribosomal-protein-alanine N-acetyltransferase